MQFDRDAVLSPIRQAVDQGRYAEALKRSCDILRTDPSDADANHFAGLAAYELNDYERARSYLEQAVRYAPRNALIHSNLGRLLELLGDLDAAERHCRLAVEIDPTMSDAHNNLANILKKLQRYDIADRHYREAVRLAPRNTTYQYNFASLLQMRGDSGEALEILERVISQTPSFLPARVNLGVMQLQDGNLEQALVHMEKALQLAPRHPQVWMNLGLILHNFGRYDEALQKYREALRLDPALGSSNLLAVLSDMQAFDALHAVATNVLKNSVVETRALGSVVGVFSSTCDFHRREQALRLWYDNVFDGNLPAAELLECHYTNTLSAQEIFSLHRHRGGIIERHAAELSAAPCDTRKQNKEKLTIGYLSPDFRSHAMGFLMQPIIQFHDRTLFEIVCYHSHRTEDAVTATFRGNCDRFHNVHRLTTQQLVERIRDDGVDILVDMAGHTSGNRLDVMPHRSAPVQVSYLGYPDTTGLRAVDYVVIDRYIAAGEGALRTETPAILPQCLLTFQPLPSSPTQGKLPCEQNAYFTFGSLSNLKKITADVIRSWASILVAVADARLLISYKGADAVCVRSNLCREFALHGISPERILFHGGGDRSEFLDRYRQIDLALDTFPYTGTATTCEALLMNVPVVTLSGSTQRERVSASVLTHVGLRELVAENVEQYVSIATGLARRPQELAALRERLPGLVQASCLGQAPRLVRDLERLYRAMWDRHLSPDSVRDALTV